MHRILVLPEQAEGTRVSALLELKQGSKESMILPLLQNQGNFYVGEVAFKKNSLYFSFPYTCSCILVSRTLPLVMNRTNGAMHGILMSREQEAMYARIRGRPGQEHTLQERALLVTFLTQLLDIFTNIF